MAFSTHVQMPEKSCLAAAALALVAFSSSAAGAEIERISLSGDQYELVVDHDEADRTVKVALETTGTEWLSIGVGNAAIDPEAIEMVRLCQDCDPVYFLPAYDASSTYGAVTGIVAWSDGSWWSLSVLPLSQPFVEDPDGDGVFDLVDMLPNGEQVEYEFREGLLREVE